MRLMFRRSVLSAEAFARDLEACEIATRKCGRAAEYLLGRQADVLFPNEEAIMAYADERGGPEISGVFEGITPAADHRLVVMMRCWRLIKDRFTEQHQHTTDEGLRVKMTRGRAINAAFSPKGLLLGWGEFLPRRLATDEPLRFDVRRGNTSLGIVEQYLTRSPRVAEMRAAPFFMGELRAPLTGKLIHSERDGPIEVLSIPTVAHVAALEPGELGLDEETLAATVKRATRDQIIDRAVGTYIREHQHLVPADEFKTVATVCAATGDDWRQISLQIVDDALHVA